MKNINDILGTLKKVEEWSDKVEETSPRYFIYMLDSSEYYSSLNFTTDKQVWETAIKNLFEIGAHIFDHYIPIVGDIPTLENTVKVVLPND